MLKNNSIIIYEKDSKEFFKLEKGLFKKKKKKIEKKELYDSNYSNFILPNLKGYPLFIYLFDKLDYHLINKTSDFGERVKFTISEFNYTKNTETVYFKGTLSNLKNDFIFETEIQSKIKNKKIIPILKEDFENFFSIAFSGIFISARDELFVLKFLYEKLQDIDNKFLYYCSVCNENFHDLDELFCHIIETKHKDSILESYPYDEEIKRIKHLINNNN